MDVRMIKYPTDEVRIKLVSPSIDSGHLLNRFRL
jgi:hypothetical protein